MRADTRARILDRKDTKRHLYAIEITGHRSLDQLECRGFVTKGPYSSARDSPCTAKIFRLLSEKFQFAARPVEQLS